jgi:GGDEF domain-containing protein
VPAPVDSAERAGDRLLEAVHEPVPLGDDHVTISLCIGLAVASPASSVDEIIARADGAAYSAKRTGRNRYVTAPPCRQ